MRFFAQAYIFLIGELSRGILVVELDMRSEWIYSRWFYFEAKVGGEVRIGGFYNNKQTNQKNLVTMPQCKVEVQKTRTWKCSSLYEI